jgi:hypothetical protein
MEPDQVDQGETSGAEAPKRPYRRPEIRRLGSVRELTLTVGTVAIADVVPGSTSKINP